MIHNQEENQPIKRDPDMTDTETSYRDVKTAILNKLHVSKNRKKH